MVANTLLPIHLGAADSDLPWWASVNLTPLAGTEWFDMARNVVVFVPLGLLLPLVARVRSARGVLLWGFLVSLTMEALQLVNDLLANTLGAPTGYGLFRAAVLLPALAHLAGAATWPGPLHDATEARQLV